MNLIKLVCDGHTQYPLKKIKNKKIKKYSSYQPQY